MRQKYATALYTFQSCGMHTFLDILKKACYDEGYHTLTMCVTCLISFCSFCGNYFILGTQTALAFQIKIQYIIWLS